MPLTSFGKYSLHDVQRSQKLWYGTLCLSTWNSKACYDLFRSHKNSPHNKATHIIDDFTRHGIFWFTDDLQNVDYVNIITDKVRVYFLPAA